MLTNYVKDKENMIIVDYYTDDGFTGTNFNRPGFKQLFSDIVSVRVNVIIVNDLYRLGRNYLEVGNYIDKIFPIYNIRIISVNDNSILF